MIAALGIFPFSQNYESAKNAQTGKIWRSRNSFMALSEKRKILRANSESGLGNRRIRGRSLNPLSYKSSFLELWQFFTGLWKSVRARARWIREALSEKKYESEFFSLVCGACIINICTFTKHIFLCCIPVWYDSTVKSRELRKIHVRAHLCL